jgi:hypothetical protein
MANSNVNLNINKTCKTCNNTYDLTNFSKGQGKYKTLNDCKKCDAERRKLYYHSMPDNKRTENRIKQRLYEYKKIYGLPHKLAEKLANNREGKCLICNEIKLLVVDHCHKTGEVRGLICSHCNSVLGYAKDNIITLENAVKYLKGE